jgi:hypothetical protein
MQLFYSNLSLIGFSHNLINKNRFYSSTSSLLEPKLIGVHSKVLRFRTTTVRDFWKDGIVKSRVSWPFESVNEEKNIKRRYLQIS